MADEFDNGEALPVGMVAVNRLIRENCNLFSDTQCKVCSAVLNSDSQKLAHYQSKKHASKYRRYLMIHQGEDFSPAKRMRAETAVNASDETDRNKCCPVCNMTFSSPVVAASHYEGKTHSKNLKIKLQAVNEVKPATAKPATPTTPLPKKPKATAPASEKSSGPFDRSDPEKFCQLCSATFNNPHMAQQHYAGKKHKKQETKSSLMTIYSSSGTPMPQTTPLKPLTPGSASTGSGFTCDTCNIVVNSIDQYQAHISGSKHKNNLKSMLPASFDEASPLQSAGPNPTRGPPSRFSFSTSGFSSAGFYSSPSSNVAPPPLGPASASHGPPSGRLGVNQSLLPLPPYASQNYGHYPHKNMAAPDYNSFNYFDQTY